jgi:phage portal protein BeeE
MQNAIVYRCVRMIAEAAASVPLCLYDGPHGRRSSF